MELEWLKMGHTHKMFPPKRPQLGHMDVLGVADTS